MRVQILTTMVASVKSIGTDIANPLHPQPRMTETKSTCNVRTESAEDRPCSIVAYKAGDEKSTCTYFFVQDHQAQEFTLYGSSKGCSKKALEATITRLTSNGWQVST